MDVLLNMEAAQGPPAPEAGEARAGCVYALVQSLERGAENTQSAWQIL